ncbi:reverse transcriptase domain protein [Colletotrichum plurivorum]|uniref:Reverse transcriptase domain protein n=1 Tax=Colletotrichum plurivorum TaxID=2175906 RepID=A0A8H6J7N5_9PEZI|nr:reverse transcriptase domain protein [Colletotrichum plurivorum]
MTLFPLLDEFFADPRFSRFAETVEYCASNEQIIKLEKALYGLRESGRQWQQKLKEILKRVGFEPLLSDAATYFNRKTNITISTHVDDMLVVGPDLAIQRLFEKVEEDVEVNDLGLSTSFLGVRIRVDGDKTTICQDAYGAQIVRDYGEEMKVANTPVESGALEFAVQNDEPANALRQDWHRQVLGKAQFAAIMTRPDLSAIHPGGKHHPAEASRAAKLSDVLSFPALTVHSSTISFYRIAPSTPPVFRRSDPQRPRLHLLETDDAWIEEDNSALSIPICTKPRLPAATATSLATSSGIHPITSPFPSSALAAPRISSIVPLRAGGSLHRLSRSCLPSGPLPIYRVPFDLVLNPTDRSPPEDDTSLPNTTASSPETDRSPAKHDFSSPPEDDRFSAKRSLPCRTRPAPLPNPRIPGL